MLKATKNITLTGQSMVDNTQAVYMSASISTDGNANANVATTIMNDAIYDANKVQCRQDIADFQTLVYAAQDEVAVVTES